MIGKHLGLGVIGMGPGNMALTLVLVKGEDFVLAEVILACPPRDCA